MQSRLFGLTCLILASTAIALPPPQFGENFDQSAGTAGFSGGFGTITYENPGTGGVDGVDDGFLLVTSFVSGNFGAADNGPTFTGSDVDYIENGITEITFWMNDVGEADNFEIHLSIGARPGNMWTYTEGFFPTNGEWNQFSVDLTDESLWTRTHGVTGTFEDALRNVTGFVFRHDNAPYTLLPDPTLGDLGIDNIALVPEPATLSLMIVTVGMISRRRATRS